MKVECPSNKRSACDFTGADPISKYVPSASKEPINTDPNPFRSLPSRFQSEPFYHSAPLARNDAPSSSINSIDTNPNPSNSLPSRFRSEPFHHSAPLAKADELLEDWSRCSSDCSTMSQNLQESMSWKRVTISETSSMNLYLLDPIYAQTKSYSKVDYQGFSRESFLEAVRIKKLVLSLTPPGVSTKEAVKYLLKNDVISSEEIRGIEHLILCKSTSKLTQERQDHARVVLSMQHRIETLARDPVKQLKMQGDHAETLALFSASRSSKSKKAARIRASRAA